MLLTRDDILGANDLNNENVFVPEWSGYVIVKTMTGTEKDKFESSLISGNGKVSTANIRAKIVSLTVIDGNGDRLFSDNDVEQLGKKSAGALDRVFSASKKLNAFTDDDVDELGKHSGQIQDEDSTSD